MTKTKILIIDFLQSITRLAMFSIYEEQSLNIF